MHYIKIYDIIHREVCALRGLGWGRKHSTVNYVFTHTPAHLIAYHHLIMDEMEKRGYHPDPIWRYPTYRGKTLGGDWQEKNWEVMGYQWIKNNQNPIFPEHNSRYLQECLDNLKSKGIEIDIKK